MLTEIQIKKARPRERAYKLGDAGWLYLLVTPSGGKLWRQNYRFDGKIKTLALGKYPEITLAEARARAAENRVKIAHGIDPGQARKRDRATLKTLAQDWIEQEGRAWAAHYRATIIKRLDTHLLPALGNRPVDAIGTPELEAALNALATQSPPSAIKLLANVRAIFDLAIRRGLTTSNPALALRGTISRPSAEHFAALVTPDDFGTFLRALDTHTTTPFTRNVVLFMVLVFTRPGNVRYAEWSEIDEKTATWTIPAAKTKTSEDYIVPLSRQALAILNEAKQLTGHRRYVFSIQRDAPLARGAIRHLIQKIGYENIITLHGFRATARTMLHEVLHYPPDAIEAQLGHTVPDRLGRAYNRTRHLDIRREMMQAWADFLDDLRKKAQ